MTCDSSHFILSLCRRHHSLAVCLGDIILVIANHHAFVASLSVPNVGFLGYCLLCTERFIGVPCWSQSTTQGRTV